MAHVRFHRRKRVHPRLSEKNRTQGHTRRNTGRFGWGWYHYPRHVLHVYEHPRAGCQTGVLCRVGILAERCSRRTQKACGTAMRLCASLFRGAAAPQGCVIFLQFGDVAVFFAPCAVLSERARWGWYLYPQIVLRVSETLRGQVSERQTLPLWGLGRRRSRRTQRACGTAMRLCASLSRGVAAPLGCAALTVGFLAFLLLLKTTIANSLTPWYYGVTKSEAIG